MTREIDRSVLFKDWCLRLKLVGGDLWEEECEKNMAPDPILALLAFTDSDSTTYRYQSRTPMPSFSFKKIND